MTRDPDHVDGEEPSGPDGRGWVKLHRRICESAVFASPTLLKVWVWAMTKAAHRQTWVPMRTGRGTTQVELQPGQFIYGRNTAADELDLPPSTVSDLMRRLASIGNINIQPDTHYSIVSVCNWQAYQNAADEGRQPSQQATDRQATPIRHKEESQEPQESLSEKKSVRSRNQKPVRTWGADAIAIPASLDTPGVRVALADWLAHKGPSAYASKSGSRPLERIVAKYEARGPQKLIDDIDRAITAPWQNFYYPDQNQTNGNHTTAPVAALSRSHTPGRYDPAELNISRPAAATHGL